LLGILVAGLMPGMTGALQAQDAAVLKELGEQVERFLGEREEAATESVLKAVLGRADATGANVLAALKESAKPLAAESEVWVPYRDQNLPVKIRIPSG